MLPHRLQVILLDVDPLPRSFGLYAGPPRHRCFHLSTTTLIKHGVNRYRLRLVCEVGAK